MGLSVHRTLLAAAITLATAPLLLVSPVDAGAPSDLALESKGVWGWSFFHIGFDLGKLEAHIVACIDPGTGLVVETRLVHLTQWGIRTSFVADYEFWAEGEAGGLQFTWSGHYNGDFEGATIVHGTGHYEIGPLISNAANYSQPDC